MNIAFFGSSLVSAFWNGAATYYRGVIGALHALGHKVTFFEPHAYGRQEHRDIPDPYYATVVVYEATEQGVTEALVRARSADVVVKASGVGVFDELLERGVLEQQCSKRVVVFWDVDAPATLDRVHKGDPFGALIPLYDGILTYGGGAPVVDRYKQLGARECVPVYNALDPSTHFPVDPDARFIADLAFLGNRLPDREARVHEFFFSAVKALPQRRFLLGGSGWEQDAPELPNLAKLGHVFTTDHNAFNCSPLAVLNICRQSMASYGFSPATRVFEAAGAGACIITDAWEGIDGFLEPGQECLVAHNGKEVVDLVGKLDPETARAIGDRARERILDEHTYAHRARIVERALLECRATRREATA